MNKLDCLAEFKRTLASYRISEESKRILAQTKLVLLAAPTSAGRNTIIRELLHIGEYHFIISDTTRKPRVQDGELEQNGVHYWFRTEEEMLEDLKSGKFLEAAIIHNQQVSGISIRELANAHKEDKIGITDIEIVGVHNVMQAKSDALAIFVLPPSFAEWQKRISKRGKMHGAEYRRRLESAIKEFAAALEHDYYQFVINDTLEHTVQQIHELVRFGQRDSQLQAQGKELTERLLLETQAFLDSSKIEEWEP